MRLKIETQRILMKEKEFGNTGILYIILDIMNYWSNINPYLKIMLTCKVKEI
jgi:hypothetical protein